MNEPTSKYRVTYLKCIICSKPTEHYKSNYNQSECKSCGKIYMNIYLRGFWTGVESFKKGAIK